MTDNELKELLSAQAKQIYVLAEQLSAQSNANAKLTSTLSKYFPDATDKPLINTITKNSYKGKDEMSYYIPKGCTFFQRNHDGRWEARIMVNGKQNLLLAAKTKEKLIKNYNLQLKKLKRPK